MMDCIFFSSRRRRTRYWRDWSSDVCSSDRRALFGEEQLACPRCGSRDTEKPAEFGSTACKALWRCRTCREPLDHFKCISEERRVGKECSSRRSPYHSKRKSSLTYPSTTSV